MKRCPLCAEEIQDAAIKCRYCGATEVPAHGGSPAAWLRAEPPEVSAMAVGSLVLGAAWIYWIGSITALILGYLAKQEIRRSPQKFSGIGLANVGIVLGWIGVTTLVILIAIVLSGGIRS